MRKWDTGSPVQGQEFKGEGLRAHVKNRLVCSSKPHCLQWVVSKELTAQLNLWTIRKEMSQWAFPIKVFLLKCQYYRRF